MPQDPALRTSESTPASEKTNTTQPPAYVSAEEFKAFADKFNGTQDRFAQHLTKLTEAVIESRQSHGQPSPADPPAADPDTSELVNSFLADPKGFIKRVADEAVQSHWNSNQAPVEHLRAIEGRQEVTERLRSQFDTVYGDGAFDEHILPGIEENLSQQKDPRLGASRQYMTQLVNLIKGEKAESLAEVRQKHQESQKQEAPVSLPELNLHPSMVAPRKSVISPAEQHMIDKAKHVAGVHFTQKDLDMRDALAEGLGGRPDWPGVALDDLKKWSTDWDKAHEGQEVPTL